MSFIVYSVVSDLLSVVNFQTLKSLKRPLLSLKMSVVQLQAEDSVQFTAVCLILFKNQVNVLQVHSPCVYIVLNYFCLLNFGTDGF